MKTAPRYLMKLKHMSDTHILSLHSVHTSRRAKKIQVSCVFFAVHGLYIFVLPTRCLRLAYAVAVFSYAGTICLDLPTRAYAYQLFSDFAYAACVCCFCGLSVGLNSSHFAYAVGASVVS